MPGTETTSRSSTTTSGFVVAHTATQRKTSSLWRIRPLQWTPQNEESEILDTRLTTALPFQPPSLAPALRRILVVDDNAASRRHLHHLLAPLAVEVVTVAPTGIDARLNRRNACWFGWLEFVRYPKSPRIRNGLLAKLE